MIRYMAENWLLWVLLRKLLLTLFWNGRLLPPPVLTTKWQSHIPSSALPKKNIGFVIVNEKPLRWGTFDVQIIMMIGVNHQQRMDFKYVYSNLLEHFENSTTVEKAYPRIRFS